MIFCSQGVILLLSADFIRPIYNIFCLKCAFLSLDSFYLLLVVSFVFICVLILSDYIDTKNSLTQPVLK